MSDYGIYNKCTLCPRSCGAARSEGRAGICQVTGELKVARAALHFWEEPCISGSKGSGAVFFSGCPLHCVFCQNEAISHGRVGKEIPVERLAEIFLELQEKGANNINLVTPGHYVPQIIEALDKAKRQGLVLPIVYNSSGYEKVDTIKSLEGIVDVYLPDFKYMDPALAKRYSGAEDYPAVAKAALEEMVRQQPKHLFYPESLRLEALKLSDEDMAEEAEEDLLIRRGVIVRQLLLPGQTEDGKAILRYLHKTYGSRIYISMMSQYTPLPHVKDYPELTNKVKREDYEDYVDYAIDLGVELGFIQEGETAEESFIPSFDCEGV